MITEEHNGLQNIDNGLTITFNGKHYTFLGNGVVKDYPIGGLACEYFDLAPTEIKDVIMSLSNLNAEPTPDIATDGLMEFYKKCFDKFPPVQATMIMVEFASAFTDWFTAIREQRVDEYLELIDVHKKSPQICQFIFADTPYENVGKDSLLQMFLSAYVSFADTYVYTKYTFMHSFSDESATPDEDDNKAINLLSDLYSSLIDMQHIDFRILCTDRGLENMYTIKTSLSLLIFEHANSFNNNVQFVKCANCGKIFIPEGRSDTIYCSRPAPQNKDKTCKDIGAQIARANKEKTDTTTHE